MLPIFLVGTVAIVTVGGYLWSTRRPRGEQEQRWWCCPHCDRKLRYPSTRAGHTALCPGCKRRLTLPLGLPVASSANKTEGYRVRRKAG
jgi:uncharacterized paraquat-inducible protein A